MRRIAAISTVIRKDKASHAPTIVGKYLFGFNEDGQRPGLVPRSSRSTRTRHLTTISAAIGVRLNVRDRLVNARSLYERAGIELRLTGAGLRTGGAPPR